MPGAVLPRATWRVAVALVTWSVCAVAWHGNDCGTARIPLTCLRLALPLSLRASAAILAGSVGYRHYSSMLVAASALVHSGGFLGMVQKRIPPKLEALTPHKGHIHKRREQGTEVANAQAARRRAQFMAERGGRGSNPGGYHPSAEPRPSCHAPKKLCQNSWQSSASDRTVRVI